MKTLYKRISGGLWIALAGALATILGLVVENVDALELSDTVSSLLVITLTAIISQITKQLNSKK
jgi:hypothetical protein